MDADSIIEAFTVSESLPTQAIAEATARREELLPRFLEELEAFIAGTEEDEVPTPVFMIFHLLGRWHETRAYRTMARVLAVDSERLGWALGEAEVETVHRVMVNVYDGDPQPLFDIIETGQASEYVRSNMLKALVMLVRQGDLARDTVLDYLRAAPERLKPQGEHFVWYGVQMAVALLGASELAGMVKRLFDRGFVPRSIMSYKHFEEDLANNGANLVDEELLTPFGDIEQELASWSFSPDLSTFDAAEQEMVRAELDRLAGPVVNPYRDVGRNDPCPCGSGKKFKKCCGR